MVAKSLHLNVKKYDSVPMSLSSTAWSLTLPQNDSLKKFTFKLLKSNDGWVAAWDTRCHKLLKQHNWYS